LLSSVLTNLVDNALKYMGDAPVRAVTLRAEDRPASVYFEVQDSGPGIPTGKEERIFEPYVRLSNRGEPGIGLGLATVKRLCQAHGGAVGVRTAPGGGATFWFELPRVSAG
jgi:signal transduction histidine kinase